MSRRDVDVVRSQAPQDDERYAGAVGARLRLVRNQQGLSLTAVEATSDGEFKASALGAYERGERVISVARLQRLAALYHVSVESLLPGPPSEHPGLRPDADRDGGAGIRFDLARLRTARGPEVAVLWRFLSAIQHERQDFNGKVLTVRQDDVRAIAAALGSAVGDVLSKFRSLGALVATDGRPHPAGH